ncbi:hypothetical protein ACQ86D_23460 [Streptomyces galilaeus]
MTNSEQRELYLKAYDMERQDERAFWSTTVTYMGAAATILVTVTIVARPSAWGVWAVTPIVGLAFLAYYSQQACIGARRRTYMEALEERLCEGMSDIVVDGKPVRALVYNRYTWFFNAREPVNSVGVARVFFYAIIAIPQFLFAILLFTSCWRLWDEHRWIALAVGIIGFVLALLITIIAGYLAGEESRQTTWVQFGAGQSTCSVGLRRAIILRLDRASAGSFSSLLFLLQQQVPGTPFMELSDDLKEQLSRAISALDESLRR